MNSPSIGRVHVYTMCSCGEWVDFEDANLSGAYESQDCGGCGKTVEIHVEAEVSHPRR